ncbi:MAG: phosphoribosyltransferase [Acidimicrobiia bacterium]|nr:MAG: phosphoribosyltransferase [Acidimicrobiia bacterium]
MRYRDRQSAGEVLADLLAQDPPADPFVLGLARGGVVVADPIARRLGAPLDVLVVRKLGVPWHPELGMGAIAEGEVVVWNEAVVSRLGISPDQRARVLAQESAELARRAARYRGGSPPDLEGHTAVVVDDGLATGYTAQAAVRAARELGAAEVVLAVPVGAPDTVERLSRVADRVVCPLTPPDLIAVGSWYSDFHQVTDEEVLSILRRYR